MVSKHRIYYAIIVFVLIIMGISSRKFSNQLPVFIADNTGDVLWASMVYFSFRCFFIKKGLLWTFVGSLIFSFLIEFSQLYQADWIRIIRSTIIGALILGKGFLPIDLIRYFFGIAIAYFADFFISKRKSARFSKQ